MRRMSWRAWAAVIAFAGMSVAFAGPVQAAGPHGTQATARQGKDKGLEDAARLAPDVDRLTKEAKYDEALPLAERVLAVREKALGPNHPDVAAALHALGEIYRQEADFAHAEPIFQRALAIREKVLGPEHPDVAQSLNDLATLFRDKGEFPTAEPLFQRALAILEKVRGKDHPDVAQSLNNLAVLYWFKGDYARAEPLNQRALIILERFLGPDHPDVADSLNTLALLYHDTKGDYAGAEPLYQRSLAILEKAHGKDHPDVAISLNNLAQLYEEKGDFRSAEPLYERSLTIREKAFAPDHPSIATGLDSLAWLYQAKGDYARAEPLFQRSLSLREKTLGPDHPLVASALNSLAGVYQAKGDHARAEPLAQRALTIREALGPDHPAVAVSLNNLALLHQAKGDYAGAEPLSQRALAILEKAFGRDHPDVGYCLHSLALLYYAREDYGRAETLNQRSMTLWQNAFGADHPLVAKPLNNLALLYIAKGDYTRAEPLNRRALAIREKALGPKHPDVAESSSNMAVLCAAQGRLVEAVSAARRATEIQDHNAAAVLATGSEEQKRLYMNTLAAQTHNDISLHLQHAPRSMDAARVALTALLRRKGRVLETMTDSLAALRQSLTPADQALADELASVYSQLATQLSRGLGEISVEQYRKNIAVLEEERQKLEAQIGERNPAFRVEKRLVTLNEVQAAIPRSAALLEIARYEPIQLGSATRPKAKSKSRYVAYVLHPTGEPAFVDLGDAAPIESAVDALRRALSDSDLTRDPKPAARALDRLLMQPIRQLLGDTRWVFVSADGPLHLVPFAALIDENDRYLVDRYLFSYVNTGRDLLRFAAAPSSTRGAPLVLANPAYDESHEKPTAEATHRGLRSIDMVTQRFLSLTGTVQEANHIRALFPDSRVLTGADATEEAVKAARAPRVLHLATHGFFLPEQPIPEVLLRATVGEPTPAERAAILQRENPLLRSGIALAGFNRRASGKDDGVLTALEAAGLDLYGTRLVVLSACETGLGQASSGEGVYGLRRALSMAGAETQVMSLWQVDTGRTRELMQSYYERLKGGGGRSEAMRNVQLAMLENPETAHPNLWASFIVSGDWRALEGAGVMPDLKVHPGPRGCACAHAGDAPSQAAGWLSIVLGLVAIARTRSLRGSSAR